MRMDVSRHARRFLATGAALAAMLCSVGCGGAWSNADSGVGRTKVVLDIDSDPIGAIIRINGIRVGTTPSKVAVEVNEDGTAWDDVVLSIDHRTNARAPNSEEVRVLVSKSGDDLPARFFFRESSTEEVRRIGRALIKQ